VALILTQVAGEPHQYVVLNNSPPVFTNTTYNIGIVDGPARRGGAENLIQDPTIISSLLLGVLSNDWSFVVADLYSKFEAQDIAIAELRADNAKLRADHAKLFAS
jgi:hypothetical protein